MGQVIPFIVRVREGGEWSEAERGKLEELADRLAQAGVRVDVTYGATDEGDPWCAVTDESGEVLIHVARIGGTFIVHSALDDTLSEGADLHSALRDQLHAAADWAAPPTSAEILPFEARRAQTLLALVVAAAFFYETAGPAPAHAGEAPQPTETPHEAVAPPHELPAGDDERQLAIQGAAVSDETHAPPPAAAPVLQQDETATIVSAPAAAPPQAEPEAAHTPAAAPLVLELAEAPQPAAPEAPAEIHGTDGDDHLVGTAASERVLGGAGNDTLESGGGHDTLDGGAGDDRIEVAAKVVSIGGQGADTFVIARPVQFGHPDQLLGRIVDYAEADGDRVITWRGEHVPLPPARPDEAGAHTLGPSTFTATGPTTTTRVDVDLDGDGHVDGYLLFGHDAKPPPEPPPAPPPEGEPAIGLVGHSLAWHDPGT